MEARFVQAELERELGRRVFLDRFAWCTVHGAWCMGHGAGRRARAKVVGCKITSFWSEPWPGTAYKSSSLSCQDHDHTAPRSGKRQGHTGPGPVYMRVM